MKTSQSILPYFVPMSGRRGDDRYFFKGLMKYIYIQFKHCFFFINNGLYQKNFLPFLAGTRQVKMNDAISLNSRIRLRESDKIKRYQVLDQEVQKLFVYESNDRVNQWNAGNPPKVTYEELEVVKIRKERRSCSLHGC